MRTRGVGGVGRVLVQHICRPTGGRVGDHHHVVVAVVHLDGGIPLASRAEAAAHDRLLLRDVVRPPARSAGGPLSRPPGATFFERFLQVPTTHALIIPKCQTPCICDDCLYQCMSHNEVLNALSHQIPPCMHTTALPASHAQTGCTACTRRGPCAPPQEGAGGERTGWSRERRSRRRSTGTRRPAASWRTRCTRTWTATHACSGPGSVSGCC